ncbi:hypothetical protein BS78_01G271000 [Paspalum vaginatum]|nr:hypothetical protein BS78_01G271000 [Paspalum vaginatum]
MPPHAPPPWRSPRPACTPYAHPPSAPPASPPAAPPPPRRTHRIRSSPSAPPTPRWWPCRRRRHAPRRRRRRHARGAGRDRRTRGRPGAAPQASGTRRLRRLCVHSFRRRLLCHRGGGGIARGLHLLLRRPPRGVAPGGDQHRPCRAARGARPEPSLQAPPVRARQDCSLKSKGYLNTRQ